MKWVDGHSDEKLDKATNDYKGEQNADYIHHCSTGGINAV